MVVVTVQRRILTSLDFFLYKHYSVAPRVVLSLLAVGVLIPLEYLVQVLSPQVFCVFNRDVGSSLSDDVPQYWSDCIFNFHSV